MVHEQSSLPTVQLFWIIEPQPELYGMWTVRLNYGNDKVAF